MTAIDQAARQHSAARAALLSFVWPGLGHAYLGNPRAAALFAAPALLVTLLALWQLLGGLEKVAIRALDSTVLLATTVLVVLLGAWRILAISSAFARARAPASGSPGGSGSASPWSDPRALALPAGLVAIVLVTHGFFVWGGLVLHDATSRIFVGGGGQVSRGPVAGLDRPDVGPLPTPYETPDGPDARVTVLLVGVDSGLGYNHSLSDTMMVISLDPTTNQVAMLSLPRDLGRLPMYDGSTYSGKLNSLLSTAARNPSRYPDGGLGTLSREISFLLGIPVHYYALIDLAGFQAMIDAVGGVSIVNDRAIADPGYKFPDGKVGFFLSAGEHELDGRTALAYVRSRNGPGDNDFTRARRQQKLLIALRAKVTSPSILPNFQGILDAAARTISTSVPPDRIDDLLEAAKQVDDDTITRKVLGPPFAQRAAGASTYILVPDMERFRRLSIELFGDDSAYASGG